MIRSYSIRIYNVTLPQQMNHVTKVWNNEKRTIDLYRVVFEMVSLCMSGNHEKAVVFFFFLRNAHLLLFDNMYP